MGKGKVWQSMCSKPLSQSKLLSDAHFFACSKATFGPTRSSLADLKTDQGYEEWILRQMSLDARLIVVDWVLTG